ncbi:MAG: ArsR/SmtB family transcription factor [Candidatus Izemoplasmatales bacterium]
MEKKIVDSFKALSDANRLAIVELLLQGETCGCTMIDKLPISQPTLSYHLKTLTEAGLAIAKREGNWIKHQINKERLSEMITYLEYLRDLEGKKCRTK